MFKKLTLLLLGFLCIFCMAGCVSYGYHRRTLLQTRRAELDNAIRLATKVCKDELEPRDMLRLLKDRKSVHFLEGQ